MKIVGRTVLLLIPFLCMDLMAQRTISSEVVKVNGIDFQKTIQQAESVTYPAANITFYDFHNDAFGRVLLHIDNPKDGDTLYVRTGECMREGRVDRNPGGSRRYREMMIITQAGQNDYDVPVPRDKRNTGRDAIKMPKEIGDVTPFRYLEVEAEANEQLTINNEQLANATRVVINVPFNDNAASFHCDNDTLNKIWELCKHTVKATTYTGYYVDGDRERIPYEADALINQLCHYAVDTNYVVARRTFEYLLKHPTWPTEWMLQMNMIAWNDYLYTGNTDLIENHLEELRAHTLIELLDDDTCLISTRRGQSKEFLKTIARNDKIRDIVDWPHSEKGSTQTGEDDGYVYRDFNTVVNAFHYESVKRYADMLAAIGKTRESKKMKSHCRKVYKAFNKFFFDKERGYYTDGIGTNHASLHANMFALAFGLVPEKYKKSVADFIVSRGMACSVYGAQFLLDALYNCGRGDEALKFMLGDDKRSWVNMMREGSTMTMEAWSNEYKPNQDWNHAWGAAPANIIPFRLVGIRPLKPNFEEIEFNPQIGSLKVVECTLPTPRGQIHVKIKKTNDADVDADIDAPKSIRIKSKINYK